MLLNNKFVVYLSNKTITIMKSELFKSAWSIFRMQNVSFSEALQLAWSNIKNGVKAVILKCNKLVKSAGLGFETIYFKELIFVSMITKRSVCDNSGASKWYDGKTFNND